MGVYKAFKPRSSTGLLVNPILIGHSSNAIQDCNIYSMSNVVMLWLIIE